MDLYRFRGHASGLDLEATVARLPGLAGRAGAVEALRQALDEHGTALGERSRSQLQAVVEEWDALASQARASRLRRASPRLEQLPDELARAAALVPDAAAIVRQALPRGPMARLVARQPAARLSRQALDGLARVLQRRLDPQIARHLARDSVLEQVRQRALVLLDVPLDLPLDKA